MPLGKLFKTSLQHIARNKGLAFASIVVMTLTFLISSTFGAAFYVTTNILDYVDKKIPVRIFVDNKSSDQQLSQIENLVKSLSPNSKVKYNPKEISYDIYVRANANSPSLVSGVTPDMLPGFFDITVPSQRDALDLYNGLFNSMLQKTDTSLDDLKAANKYFVQKDNQTYILNDNYNFVNKISLSQSTSEFFSNLKNFVQIVGLIMGIFLIAVSLIIIFITTGMAIYSNRDEIETMELVGATPMYVRIPYVFDGALFGFIGAFLSTSVIFAAGYLLVKKDAGGIASFLNRFFVGIQWLSLSWIMLILLFVGVLLVGAMIGALASTIATKRYLK